MKNKLINSAKDPKTFWSTLKRISSKKRVTGNIDKDVWLENFSNVFKLNLMKTFLMVLCMNAFLKHLTFS